MKPRQDNNMINHTSAFYIENNIKLIWLVESGAVYDEY